MKEIKILIRNLRQYPDNLFVYPEGKDNWDVLGQQKAGLEVCDKDGDVVGFIETGTDDGNVVVN